MPERTRPSLHRSVRVPSALDLPAAAHGARPVPVGHARARVVDGQGFSSASAAGVLTSPMHRAQRTPNPAGSDLRDDPGTSVTLRDWCGGVLMVAVLFALQAMQQILEAL